MKNKYLMLATLMFSLTLFGQSPEKFTYQSIIRDGDSKLVALTTVGMQISIHQSTADGIVIYSEVHNPTSNINGLVTVEVGAGSSNDDFTVIDWTNGPFFIQTEIDPSGGSNYTIDGVNQLLSVPFALHATTAETVTGELDETDPVYGSSAAANVTEDDITHLGDLSGINTGDQDLRD